MRRASRLAAVLALVAAVACGAGFAWFLHRVAEPMHLPKHADAIVAFTGGPDRVETALRLLAEGRADRLLLSGIGGGANLAELARLAELDPRPIAARVSIGREATSTRGNALETAAWAHANGVNSLLVVTASYHMPRALAELGRALPDVALYPVPVVPRDGTAAPLRLTAEEYVKFLAAETGLTALLQPRGHAG